MEYTELQKKGMETAGQYCKLPLQAKIDVIAETFGCKTGSIKTSPCTGKWRGTSDISLVLDNGCSLFLDNHRTRQAKTVKVQNECVNSALARYNPEIVAQTKARAIPALLMREAKDNAIAEKKGLKPYTFLTVEMNDGSDQASGGYLGWYYVTLAVDGKIFAFLETGLSYDIARGEFSDRPNYFVAGALKERDVDFVFNNVGHSSVSGSYKLPLSGKARANAEKAFAERTAPGRCEKPSIRTFLNDMKKRRATQEQPGQAIVQKPHPGRNEGER